MIPLRLALSLGLKGLGTVKGTCAQRDWSQRSTLVLLPWFRRCRDRRLAEVKTGTAIALGALLGLALVSVITDVPLAPEAGLVS